MDIDLTPTPWQTVGPYFAISLAGGHSVERIASPNARGERVKLMCSVFDGEGQGVEEGLIEIWQANADGRYNHPDDPQDKPVDPDFLGFGRQATDENGVCVFDTIRPGRVPGPNGAMQAPHLAVSVLARGILRRLPTRIYFAGDPANDRDPVLALVPKERRETLMAQPVAGQPGAWRFDIHLSGENETVFFDV
ncbi:MAG TPA: protocatechuate 3,4-dioxygenase subunit alpha [Candidatus Baltobacteraceae bacterium]|nr:protocatechuate 3,4-dioxygenase subunit alpha [Candidatus Baltobacteraceae bacterium]